MRKRRLWGLIIVLSAVVAALTTSGGFPVSYGLGTFHVSHALYAMAFLTAGAVSGFLLR